jgi:uncharacterized MnhB-related membrane protein
MQTFRMLITFIAILVTGANLVEGDWLDAIIAGAIVVVSGYLWFRASLAADTPDEGE